MRSGNCQDTLVAREGAGSILSATWRLNEEPMTIAFLGAGNMGEPMARNLLSAGHQLRSFNRPRAKTATLEEAGAAVASSVSDAVRGADVLVTMLANDDAVHET